MNIIGGLALKAADVAAKAFLVYVPIGRFRILGSDRSNTPWSRIHTESGLQAVDSMSAKQAQKALEEHLVSLSSSQVGETCTNAPWLARMLQASLLGVWLTRALSLLSAAPNGGVWARNGRRGLKCGVGDDQDACASSGVPGETPW